MAFRNRYSMRPVNRIKHVFDVQNALVAGTQVNTTIAASTDTPTLADTDGVETGSKIGSFFIVVEAVATSSAALPNCYFILFKNVGGNLGTPPANTVGANDNKRYVIHQEMVMFQEQTGSNPRTIFKGVIKIPRGYQRNGPNDLWQIGLLAPGVSVNFCIQVHYKEFR